jgi:hypothetical protein
VTVWLGGEPHEGVVIECHGKLYVQGTLPAIKPVQSGLEPGPVGVYEDTQTPVACEPDRSALKNRG